jgi:hypothetical protein
VRQHDEHHWAAPRRAHAPFQQLEFIKDIVDITSLPPAVAELFLVRPAFPFAMRSTESARQKLLYHYTTAESLLGIVQSRSLWATDIRFLNDTAEFSFARDVLLREMLARADRLRNERVRLLIRKELAALQVMAPPPAYVISLSRSFRAIPRARACSSSG